jgi:hypothetical protein
MPVPPGVVDRPNQGRSRRYCSAKSSPGEPSRIADDAGLILVDPASLTSCRACGFPIPLPRLGALPGTNVCGACAAEGAKPRPAPAYPQPPADRVKCPRCGKPTVVRQNSEDQGFFLGCTGFPTCRWTQPFES